MVTRRLVLYVTNVMENCICPVPVVRKRLYSTKNQREEQIHIRS
ncbi:unnamed protein product, partial [Linum tenue]